MKGTTVKKAGDSRKWYTKSTLTPEAVGPAAPSFPEAAGPADDLCNKYPEADGPASGERGKQYTRGTWEERPTKEEIKQKKLATLLRSL